MAEQTVYLAPGESKSVSFEVTPTVAKTYPVSVNGLTGSFRATEAPVEVIDFDLTRPTVSPATITPGTAITITCPVTSRCTKLQTITAKVIIYEGSILPGHGSVIATKTSPSFSISPGEAYNVIVSHTAIAGTIDRRDIEVEVYIAGTLVKESEWDDVYYVEKPAIPDIIVDLDVLSVLDVEGIEFTSIGEETMQDWEAFGRCLGQTYGGAQYFEGYIADGIGLARCMEAMGAATGATLYQCGLAHPEYLTSWAQGMEPPFTGTNWEDSGWCGRHGLCDVYGAYIGPPVGSPIDYLAGMSCVISRIVYEGGGRNWYCQAPHHCSVYYFPNVSYEYIGPRLQAISIACTIPGYNRWGALDHQRMVNTCASALAPFTGLVATLAEPIEMSELRGVSLRWLNKTIPTYADCGTIWILQYKPAFSAPMPPPGFRLISLGNPPVGETKLAPITGCFAGGYYYPGIYDGIVTVSAGCNYRDGDFVSYVGGGQFMIKNLAKVTGEGTVVPPGY